MTLFETVVGVLGVITFLALVVYLLYGGIHRAFRRVGFTPHEASIILAGTFIGSFLDVPLFEYNDWTIAVNVGGAIVPIVVTFLLLRRRPDAVIELLGAAVVVALVTYLVTSVTPVGIASAFPFYLLPPIAAAAMSLGAFWREESFAAPLAYMAGTLGTLVGADVLRLGEFLAQAPPTDRDPIASIGGAAVLDMVFLTGIVAVAFDTLFFEQVHRRVQHARLPYVEHVVFTTSTPSDVIAAYRPEVPSSRSREEPPRSGGPRTPPAAPASLAGDRLARHREWQARVKGRA